MTHTPPDPANRERLDPVAHWIERSATDAEAAGSSPIGIVIVAFPPKPLGDGDRLKCPECNYGWHRPIGSSNDWELKMFCRHWVSEHLVINDGQETRS